MRKMIGWDPLKSLLVTSINFFRSPTITTDTHKELDPRFKTGVLLEKLPGLFVKTSDTFPCSEFLAEVLKNSFVEK